MKKKFIIVDTWNGEGYTDSSHEIIESSDVNDVHDYCISRAKECISIDMGKLEDMKGESFGEVSYEIGDAQGCIHWRYLSEDDIAVAINPVYNEYWMIESQVDLQEMMTIIKANSDEDFEEEAIIGGYHHNGLGDGDVTIQTIDSVTVNLDLNPDYSYFKNNLCDSLSDTDNEEMPSIFNGTGMVFHDGGDGIEYEIWREERTNKLYRVPIEIVRDFALMEETGELGI